jgi:peptide subunit release factor 1 (eRF1)
MLDSLLGRAELKERIAALEEERDSVQAQLDAERERRKDAVSDRQTAEERVNRLEDKIAELEGRLDTEESDTDLAFRRQASLRGERLETVLDRLRSVETGPEGALTAVVEDDRPDAVTEQFGEHAALLDRAAPCVVYTDDAGLVSAALRPPLLPDPFVEWADSFTVTEEWFRPTGEHTVALVRSDVFALGAYDGDDRQAVEGFTTDVKSDHSKGGFSQSRFERLRDEQIEEHLEDCRAAIADREHDRLIVLGQRPLVAEFADEAVATAAVDATGKPEAALEQAVRDFWTTRLYAL